VAVGVVAMSSGNNGPSTVLDMYNARESSTPPRCRTFSENFAGENGGVINCASRRCAALSDEVESARGNLGEGVSPISLLISDMLGVRGEPARKEMGLDKLLVEAVATTMGDTAIEELSRRFVLFETLRKDKVWWWRNEGRLKDSVAFCSELMAD
jgi:hypothetical protein